MGRVAKLVVRCTAAAVLSLLVTLPTSMGIASYAAHVLEERYYAGMERPPLGEDDLGIGFVGVAAIGLFGLSVAVLWPLAFWGSYRLVRKFAS